MKKWIKSVRLTEMKSMTGTKEFYGSEIVQGEDGSTEWCEAVSKKWLNKFSAYKKLASITVGYLDMETMNIVNTQMYIDGYQVKLVSDTSYGSLWEVSFVLKEF